MNELITIQSQLKAPKGQYNKFGGFYYRSAEDILEAVKPILKTTECYLTLSDSIKVENGIVFVESTATLTNKDGKQVSTIGFAGLDLNKKGMDASQVTGSASSYARKYALNGLFCIDDNKDADSNEAAAVNAAAAKRTISAAEQKAIDEANACKTRDELAQVWNKYKASAPAYCAPESAFCKAVTQVGKKFKK